MDEDGFIRVEDLLRQERSKFHEWLGKFVLAFSATENSVYSVFLQYAKMSPQIGRSVFSGARARDMMEHLNRIAINTNLDRVAHNDLTFVFEQLAAINTMRDRIVHYGNETFYVATMAEGGPISGQNISNKLRAGQQSKSFEHEITSSLLENMVRDLSRIRESLDRHTRTPFIPHPRSGEPWLYKFPQPKNAKGKSRQAHPKRPRQQKSSHPK